MHDILKQKEQKIQGRCSQPLDRQQPKAIAEN